MTRVHYQALLGATGPSNKPGRPAGHGARPGSGHKSARRGGGCRRLAALPTPAPLFCRKC